MTVSITVIGMASTIYWEVFLKEKSGMFVTETALRIRRHLKNAAPPEHESRSHWC
jgi:hypothetical protein